MNQMEIVTTKCSEWGHPEFRLEFDAAIPQVDVDVLVSFLEQSVENGTRYEHGQSIELGSMILWLVAVDGYFNVEEPDLLNVPLTRRVGVTQSLRTLRLHKDIAESVGLGDELDFPSIRHSLTIGTDLSIGVDAFVLERLESQGLDSGWFVGRFESQLDYSEAANLRRVSLYQAILNWPRIAGFLALPTDSRVEMSPKGLEISRYGRLLEIQEGSFLDVASF